MPLNRIYHYLTLSILLVVFATPVVFAEVLLRGPYLQQGDSDSMIIKWRSDVATDSRVEFGTSQSDLNMSVSHSAVLTEHEVEITGLNPSTRYYYNIGNSTSVLAGGDAEHYFETSPVRGTAATTRIWVTGDAGTVNSDQLAVYNAYRNFTGTSYTDLWLMLGDNAYNDGTDAEYQAAFFNIYPEILRQTPVWSTLGNNDGDSADSATQTGPYYDIFSFPRNGEVGGVASGTEAYYSFDYANIHFIVLDSSQTSRSPSDAMMNWLLSDLQNVTADWLVAFWHHPPYSKGHHDSDSEFELIEMRENFLPVLETYGVDLVLSGHSHSYERSKYLDGHYGTSSSFHSSHEIDGGSGRIDDTGAYVKNGNQPNAGAVYAVVGASGQTNVASLTHPAMNISLNQLGSMVIDVNGLTIEVKYIDDTGAVADYFTITKDTMPRVPPTAAPTNLAASADSSSAISLSWADNADNETGFDIERSLDSTNWSPVGTTGINATSYLDTGLTELTTYFYRVRATNSAGSSDYSDVASATTEQAPTFQTVTLQEGLNGYAGTQDSFVTTGAGSSNWGNDIDLAADGDEGTLDEIIGLVQWDVSSLPPTSNVTKADLTLEVWNGSAGTYDLYAMNGAWNEDSVTWDNANINANLGVQVGTFNPASSGAYTLSLNAAGISLVQSWIAGTAPNNGLIIRSTGTGDGVYMRSSEYANLSMRPALSVTYDSGTPLTPPVDPTNLVAIATTHDTINLSWTDNADNETVFDIQRSPDGNSWSLIATVNSNITSYTNIGLTEVTTYYYRVSARNIIGSSAVSNIANATTQQGPTPPLAPSDLVASATAHDTINLSWTDNADNETVFDIQRSLDGNNWSLIAIVNSNITSYTNIGLTEVTTYYYRVSARNIISSSAVSNIANATTQQGLTPPLAPSNLVASATAHDTINLSWADNADNETGFEIERSLDGTNWSPVGTTGSNATGYLDTGLTELTTYFYRVRATNSAGSSDYSDVASATTQQGLTPPLAPSNLVASATAHDTINLSWADNADNETGFEIERSLDGTNWSPASTTGINATSYLDTGLTELTTYFYRVRATNSAGSSDYSDVASATTQQGLTPPLAPSNLVASATAHDTINLSWADNADNETGFEIERSLDGTNWSPVGTTGSNATSYIDTGLTELTTYFYRVRATNSAGSSDYSDVASATTQQGLTPPLAPSNLVATATAHDTTNLSWTDNADNETGFEIERSLDSSNWNLIGTAGVNATSYLDTGLTELTTYYYRVRATNSAGSSDYSDVASATTEQAPTFQTVTLQEGLNGYAGTQDSFVTTGAGSSNWGNDIDLAADGNEGSVGEIIGLIQWDVSLIPPTSNVTKADLTLDVWNGSAGTYNLYAMNGAWSEDSVTWDNANINANLGVQVGTFNPASSGAYTLSLNAAGISLVKGWVDGTTANHGLIIRSTGTGDGVYMRSSEYGTISQRPMLTVTHQ